MRSPSADIQKNKSLTFLRGLIPRRKDLNNAHSPPQQSARYSGKVRDKFAAALAAEALFPRRARRIAGRIATAIVIAGLTPLALHTLQRILASAPTDFAPFADAARALFDRLPPIFFQKPESVWLAALFIAISMRAVVFIL